MPENIRCRNCGTTLLGFSASDPKPVGRDDCPGCGGTEFDWLGDGTRGE